MEKILEAIFNRDTLGEPCLIIDNILENQGFGNYKKIAGTRIMERLDEHPECDNDIRLDLFAFDIRVTVFGFLLIKDIMLSYITEERFNKYLKLLRLERELVEHQNVMIKFLKEQKRKKLKSMLVELKTVDIHHDHDRVDSYIRAELKARSYTNKLTNTIKGIRRKYNIWVRGLDIQHAVRNCRS